MYLLDTCIWMEVLLEQAQAADVSALLKQAPRKLLFISEFSLYGIGNRLVYLKQHREMDTFVRDVILEGGLRVIRIPPSDLHRVTAAAVEFKLDFDDAYQHAAAEIHGFKIVSFDRHFDRTRIGRVSPSQVLAELNVG